VLITGVATERSIAFAIAREAQRAGAEVVLTSFGRVRRMTERAARRLDRPPPVLELDARRAADFPALAAELERRWGAVDGVVHAIAFAPPDALSGEFLRTSEEDAMTTLRTSALSLRTLVHSLASLLGTSRSGSVVALDFDASVAWPGYDSMGVSKAALEAIGRYLARDLGASRIRVNLVSAGPLRTPAAGGCSTFSLLAEGWTRRAPLGWDPEDPTMVAHAVCFLLSDWSRGITGEVLHADGGYHAMGSPLAT
jgi:enoyl-[acyl-carrier protein] reductase I